MKCDKDITVERAWRNEQLRLVVDPLQLTLRYNDLTLEEQESLKRYRLELLSYPDDISKPRPRLFGISV